MNTTPQQPATLTERFDLTTHDGIVCISADAHKGIWASQTINKLQKKAFRAAGQLPAGAAHAHTLLTVALVNGLRAITKSQASKIIWNLPRGIDKPRIVVVSRHETFIEALQGVMSNTPTKPLRAGRNFFDVLHAQLRRFDITTLYSPNSAHSLALQTWAADHIIDPKVIAKIPAALRPSAVGQII